MSLSELKKYYKSRSKKYVTGWYLFPRATYFNEQNADEWRKVLIWMRDHQEVKLRDLPNYQPKLEDDLNPESLVLAEWNQDLQLELLNYMKSEGIIHPRARNQSINDQLANVRNYLNLLKKMGFGYVNKERHLHISPAGKQFIESNQEGQQSLLEQQIIKFQFWNPSLEPRTLRQYKDFTIFPYLFTLKVLLMLEDPIITVDEFSIVLAFCLNMDELHQAVSFIQELRQMTSQERSKFIRSIRPAATSLPHVNNASVHMGLFGLTPGLRFEGNALRVQDQPYISKLVALFEPMLKFIEYENFEDWYADVSRLEGRLSVIDVLRYYVETGNEEKAKALVTEPLPEEPLDFQEILANVIQERMIEDVIERNVAMLEPGLSLVANGRQFATEIGRIDLLARDKEKKFVVIELKKGQAEDEVVGQCLRYMGWVKSNLSPSSFVRGIIVGKGITSKLEHALIGLQHPNKDIIRTWQFNLEINADIVEIHKA